MPARFACHKKENLSELNFSRAKRDFSRLTNKLIKLKRVFRNGELNPGPVGSSNPLNEQTITESDKS